MDEGQLRQRVAEARVARIGTVDERGRVHLVPIVFVLDGDRLYSATDDGPRPAKRMRNLARDPRTTVLVDAYDEDWSTVWWVRLRAGAGRSPTRRSGPMPGGCCGTGTRSSGTPRRPRPPVPR
jgi:PPOX class probable F420-dependent enzyme